MYYDDEDEPQDAEENTTLDSGGPAHFVGTVLQVGVPHHTSFLFAISPTFSCFSCSPFFSSSSVRVLLPGTDVAGNFKVILKNVRFQLSLVRNCVGAIF